MAAQEEQIPVPDRPDSGGTRSGRALALARLLHHECSQLLQLYVSHRFPLPLSCLGAQLPASCLSHVIYASLLLCLRLNFT